MRIYKTYYHLFTPKENRWISCIGTYKSLQKAKEDMEDIIIRSRGTINAIQVFAVTPEKCKGYVISYDTRDKKWIRLDYWPEHVLETWANL